MSHVDDGILHAYLDGALDALSDAGELPHGATVADVVSHLATCADCRARLETERAVREGAGLVMGNLPLPAPSMPEFPALTTSTPRRKRWIPLGWAASVVLAVGAGWIGSEMWRSDAGLLSLERSALQSSTESAASGIASPESGPSADAMAPMHAGESSPDAESSDAAQSSHAMTPSDPPKLSDASESSDARDSSAAMNPSEVVPSTEPQSGSAEIAGKAALAQDPAPAAADVAPGAVAAVPVASPAPPVAAPAAQPAGTPLRFDSLVTGTSRIPLGNALVSVDERTGSPILSAASGSVRDAQNVVAGRMHEMVAFDSIIAREQSGRIHFADASPSDVRSLASQTFVIADASAPSIEVAREIGQTVVRVRQTMASGEQVEIVTWRQHAVELNALVVTGTPTDARVVARADGGMRAQDRRAGSNAPERGARAEAGESRSQQDVAPAVVVQVMRQRIRRLNDDRRELVLGTADGSVWIALRAPVSEEELRALAHRVTIR